MRVINPQGESTGRTRTMTTRLVALRPSTTDVFDGAFLLALVLLGLLGFATSFDSSRYLVLGLVGTLLGMVLAHVCNVLRWHWALPLVAAAVSYLLLGGFLALPDNLLAGFIPSVTTFVDLAQLVVNGWKELLTTLPPLPGSSPQVLLVYLVGLVAGAAGFSVARRSRSTWTAAIVPTLVLAASILLGTYEPAALLPPPQGLGFAALLFGWMGSRAQRRRRLKGTGSPSLTRVGLGAGVLIAAVGGGLLLGPWLTGGQLPNRLVLRSFVEPPVDLPSYTSPLVGFPKYSSQDPRRKRYHDQELLRLTSSKPVSLLRLAVLDSYSGIAWDATSGGSGPAGTAFQRVGSTLPQAPTTNLVEATITVSPAYAEIPELAPWVPNLGPSKSISFSGDNARNHARTFRYNLATGQGLVADSLRSGDVLQETGVQLDLIGDGPLASGGTPLLGDAESDVISSAVDKLVTKADASPGDQLRQAMASLRQGYYSDGTKPAELQYHSGHDLFRLTTFLTEKEFVGSDEHYAATLGLVAARLGFPSRVIFGAKVPADGVVKGKDIHAWVEIQVSDGSWRTIPPDAFIPTRSPEDIPRQNPQDAAAEVVPPPNPVRAPSSLDSWFELNAGLISNAAGLDRLLQILYAVLRWVGPPLGLVLLVVGGITGAKALRRRRRRTRGPATTRIAGGWSEVVDLARDLGHSVPLLATRHEQTLAVGRADLVPVARAADRAIFGPGDPTPESAAAYWATVDSTRKQLVAPLKRRQRWLTRLSLRSLLPAKLVGHPNPSRWSPFGQRGARTDATMTRQEPKGDGL